MAFQNGLRGLRVAAQLSQAELADRAGVSRPLVSAVESGRHLPNVDAALRLARALGTSVEAVFGHVGAPVDALSGEPAERGTPVRIGRVGERIVTTPPRWADDGWNAVDGLAGETVGAGQRVGNRPNVVVAGCEPGLLALEQLLRERGTRALAILASTTSALGALEAGRLHAAVAHFAEGKSPSVDRVRPLRISLARWRVGLAAPKGMQRSWWQRALGGGIAVIQREPGATAQAAFERALRRRSAPVEGPRVTSHLAACRRALETGLPAVTIEPAAAALGAAFHALETHEVELWVNVDLAETTGVARMLDLLSTNSFRQTLASVGGYDLSQIGRRIA